jgi:protein TonB
LPFASSAAEPRRITQAEAMELAATKVAPEYPAVARQLNLAGIVAIEIVVGEGGAVESAVPVSGSPVLTRPAVEALKRWKFKPLQAEGRPSPFRTVIRVGFTK